MNKPSTAPKFPAGHLSREDFQTGVRAGYRQINDAIVEGSCPGEAVDITTAYGYSRLQLPGYCTLDSTHAEGIGKLRRSIQVYADDRKRKGPLNIVLHAEPGSGKSHFVDCLAQSMASKSVSAVTVNMTAVRSADDLGGALEEARNLKVRDKLPILFLDEFDSAGENGYAMLLPLLWDGALAVNGRTLRTGKIVIMLAGSRPEIASSFQYARAIQPPSAPSSEKGVSSQAKAPTGKLVDLASRINGGELEIPALEDRKVDKVCLTLALLADRFGPGLQSVPWSLLHFIAHTRFKHGVRSMRNMIDVLPAEALSKATLNLDAVVPPWTDVATLESTHLPMHLSESGGGEALVRRWKAVVGCPQIVKFEMPAFVRKIMTAFTEPVQVDFD